MGKSASSKNKNGKKAPQVEKKVLHPLSRKAKKLTLEGIRDIKKEKNTIIRNKEHRSIQQLLLFCQKVVKSHENKKVYTEAEISDIIAAYLTATEPEEDINKSSTKSELVKSLFVDEIRKFKSNGYSAPDLTNGNTIKFLLTWDGDMKYYNNGVVMKKFKYIEPTTEKQPATETEMEN